jgi:hypothetical protein
MSQSGIAIPLGRLRSSLAHATLTLLACGGFARPSYAQTAGPGAASVCRAGTYYKNEYEVDRQRDDFEKTVTTRSANGDARAERPRADEEFHFALFKLESDRGVPKYQIVAARIAADTLSVQQGESLILLIGTVRYALHTIGPPLTTALDDGRSIESTMYDISPAIIKAIVNGREGVRVRLKGASADRDLLFGQDGYCAFARFFVDVVAKP